MQPSANWEPLPSNLPTTIAAERASSIFTKGLSRQLIERGIRVNAVAPGPFWTPIQPSGGQTPEKVVELGKSVPIGQPGQPVELAPIYVFLASQEASYVTGEIYG